MRASRSGPVRLYKCCALCSDLHRGSLRPPPFVTLGWCSNPHSRSALLPTVTTLSGRAGRATQLNHVSREGEAGPLRASVWGAPCRSLGRPTPDRAREHKAACRLSGVLLCASTRAKHKLGATHMKQVCKHQWFME